LDDGTSIAVEPLIFYPGWKKAISIIDLANFAAPLGNAKTRPQL
jgi:hypothetical protein